MVALAALVVAPACAEAEPVEQPIPAPAPTAPAHAVGTVLTPEDGAPDGIEARGYVPIRTIIHLHSAFSHDGCDDEGLDEDGHPNWPCVERMKAALCAENIGVAFMTDHPSYMRDQIFQDLLYAEPADGDELVSDPDGTPWAVAIACPKEGEGGPDGRSWLIPGYEGHHVMPVGLRRHLDEDALYSISFEDWRSDDELASVTAAVRGVGGFVTIAHAEQDDLSAETIAAHDVPAMELYNFHANFVEVLGGLGEQLFWMDAFLDPSPGAPDADLVALLMLDIFPEASLVKWRHVSALRRIAPLGGSDVHENVVLPAICEGGLCDGIIEEYPHLVAALEVGGNVILNDGDRIDSYGRIFRWVQNRVWALPDADALTAVEAGIEAARTVVVFEVLGDALGVELVATAGGEVHDVGATLTAAEGPVTLWARTPDAPVPGRVASWTDGSEAEITGHLWHTTADGESTVVHEWYGAGVWRGLVVDAPGAYHLEVTMVPRHLTSALGKMADRAEVSFRWVETSAIRLE